MGTSGSDGIITRLRRGGRGGPTHCRDSLCRWQRDVDRWIEVSQPYALGPFGSVGSRFDRALFCRQALTFALSFSYPLFAFPRVALYRPWVTLFFVAVPAMPVQPIWN